MEIPSGTTIISNYNDVGLTIFIGTSESECEAKITELQLTPIS